MLEHYRALGVDQLEVHVHATSCESKERHAIEEIVRTIGGVIASLSVVPWQVSLNTMLYSRSRSSHPDDWFIIADQDELHQYPDGLFEAIDYCDRNGYDFIEGAFVDRISSDGSLAAVRPGQDLWSQFPLGGMISAEIAGACINKIVAAKGHVRLAHGQHFAMSGRGCPVSSLYVPVHHFKWVDQTLRTLPQRVTNQSHYSLEARRIMQYLARHQRIVTDAPGLMIAACMPDYPHWNQVRDWRRHAVFFSPDLAARAHTLVPAESTVTMS